MSVLKSGDWCVNNPILNILIASPNSLRMIVVMPASEKDENLLFFFLNKLGEKKFCKTEDPKVSVDFKSPISSKLLLFLMLKKKKKRAA